MIALFTQLYDFGLSAACAYTTPFNNVPFVFPVYAQVSVPPDYRLYYYYYLYYLYCCKLSNKGWQSRHY